MTCPLCDQGEIRLVQVKSTGEILQVCDECDATWLQSEYPNTQSPRAFGTLLQSQGLKGLWSEITVFPEKPPHQE